MFKNIENTEVSKNVLILTDYSFENQIRKGITLVDCWASWCMPCKLMNPIINDIADEMIGKARICKLDVDTNKKTATELGIKSIPTIILFKDGKRINTYNGIKTKSMLIKELSNFIRD